MADPNTPTVNDGTGTDVTEVQPTTKERILKGIGGAIAGAMPPGSNVSAGGLFGEIEKHQQARLNTAKLHQANIRTAGSALHMIQGGWDPDAQMRFDDPNYKGEGQAAVTAKYTDWLNSAKEQFTKAAGVDKNTKGLVQRGLAAVDHLIGLGRTQPSAQGGAATGGNGGTGAPASKFPPPPQFNAQGQGDQSVDASPQGKGMTPPPGMQAAASRGIFGDGSGSDILVPGDINPRTGQRIPMPAGGVGGGGDYRTRGMMELPNVQRDIEGQRQLMYDQKHQDIITRGEIERDAAKDKSKPKRLQAATFQDENGNTISGAFDPSSGEYLDQNGNVVPNAKRVSTTATKPTAIHYKGTDGQPHFGYQIPGKGLFTADMQPLPANTPVFSAWMEPRQIDTWSWKEVTQPDGSIQLIPVETKSTQTRGQQPAKGGAGGMTPPPGKAAGGGTPKAARPGGVGKGVTVGGKVLPGVQKAYDGYNASQERYNVMVSSLADVQKAAKEGRTDQQAMINLLSNHMGMTMGLQKGARLNQALIEEAQNSAPALGRIAAKFDKDGYLMGVVLTPDQMNQMINLAKTRLAEDYSAYEREVNAAKKGYGMGGELPPGPATGGKAGMAKPPSAPSGPAPKTWEELKKQAAAAQAAP